MSTSSIFVLQGSAPTENEQPPRPAASPTVEQHVTQAPFTSAERSNAYLNHICVPFNMRSEQGHCGCNAAASVQEVQHQQPPAQYRPPQNPPAPTEQQQTDGGNGSFVGIGAQFNTDYGNGVPPHLD